MTPRQQAQANARRKAELLGIPLAEGRSPDWRGAYRMMTCPAGGTPDEIVMTDLSARELAEVRQLSADYNQPKESEET